MVLLPLLVPLLTAIENLAALRLLQAVYSLNLGQLQSPAHISVGILRWLMDTPLANGYCLATV